MNKQDLPKCTLTDEQLIIKAELWISKLCKTGGNAFTMQVPADMNNDTDMVFSELIIRFAKQLQTKKQMLKSVEEMNLLLDKLQQRNNDTTTNPSNNS